MDIYFIEQMERQRERIRERRRRERAGRRTEGLNDNEQINNDKRKEINNIEPSLEDLLSTPIIKNVNKKNIKKKKMKKKKHYLNLK